MIGFGFNYNNKSEIELIIGTDGCIANPGTAFDLPYECEKGS